MKAVRAIPHPDGGRIELQDIPAPVAGPGQVLVRVRASGLNRGEITQARELRSGAAITTGVEFAGEVAALGEGVTQWQTGQRVMGHGKQSQAEYVAAEAAALMPIPDNIDFVQAAAFPNAFITAHDAIITNGRLQPGESLLVNAATGGVAWAALQIAAWRGATPVMAASRSAEKLERIRPLGADVCIDSSREDQAARVKEATGGRGVDVILDMVGAPVLDANLRSLAVAGRMVNVARMGGAVAAMDLEQLWLKRLKLIGVTFRTRSEQERIECIRACGRDMLPWLAQGQVRWAIDRTFALGDIHEAHAFMMAAQHSGKIVLTLD
jgi:NADPH2:quinone reductase